jgi:hypothetical protein
MKVDLHVELGFFPGGGACCVDGQVKLLFLRFVPALALDGVCSFSICGGGDVRFGLVLLFVLGKDLMCSPVISPSATAVVLGFPGGAWLGETASPLWNKVLRASLFVVSVSSDAGDGPMRLGCSGACGRLWPWPLLVAATVARMGPCVWYRVGGKRRLDLCIFSSHGRRWRIQGPRSTGRIPGRHATEKKFLFSMGCSFGSQSSWSAMVFPRNQGRSGWRLQRWWIEEVDGLNMDFIEFFSLDLFYEVMFVFVLELWFRLYPFELDPCLYLVFLA